MSLQQEFNDYRSKMNEVILAKDNLPLKRFFSLDHQMYQAGSLDVKTKELLGLVASMVLRCDDCIKYHLGKSHEVGVNTEEIYESIGMKEADVLEFFDKYTFGSNTLSGPVGIARFAATLAHEIIKLKLNENQGNQKAV